MQLREMEVWESGGAQAREVLLMPRTAGARIVPEKVLVKVSTVACGSVIEAHQVNSVIMPQYSLHAQAPGAWQKSSSSAPLSASASNIDWRA